MIIKNARCNKRYGRTVFCLIGLATSFVSVAEELDLIKVQGLGSTTVRVSDETQIMADLTNEIYSSVFESISESLDLKLERRKKENVITLLNEYQSQLIDDTYQYLNIRSTY